MLELQKRTEEAIKSFVPHISEVNLETIQRALADCTGLRALTNTALKRQAPSAACYRLARYQEWHASTVLDTAGF